MSFQEKIKEALKKIFGDFSGLHWKDFNHKRVYATAALLAVIILIVVLVVQSFSGKEAKKKDKADTNKKEQTESVQEQEEAEKNPLEVNAHEEVNAVVQKYFDGRAQGNIDLVREVVDVLTEEEIEEIELKSKYTESYENLICYTKKGLEEGSYIAFVAYDMKIRDIETLAPGIMPLYVCRGEDGNYFIYNDDVSEELQAYVLELKDEEELAGIIADVWARYEEAMAQDADLANFVAVIDESEQEPPAEETPSEEPPAEEPPAEEQPPEEQPSEEPPAEEPSGEELAEPYDTTVTATIRIRGERSTESEMLATIAADTGVTVYAHYEDGWSKISYGDITGYCKTEYLRSGEGGQQEESSGDAAAVNKKMRLTATVRIRKERSSESDRIATGYQGEYVQAIESYGDGWSKVEYNGKTGYCLTQYLEDV